MPGSAPPPEPHEPAEPRLPAPVRVVDAGQAVDPDEPARPVPARRPAGLVSAAFGAVAAAVLLSAAGGLYHPETSGPGEDARPTAPVADDAGTDTPDVVDGGPFRLVAISASGNRLSVTFLDGTGGTASAEVASGWSDTVPNEPGHGANTFTVSTAPDGKTAEAHDTVTCRVTRDGDVLAEITTTGQAATADCGRF